MMYKPLRTTPASSDDGALQRTSQLRYRYLRGRLHNFDPESSAPTPQRSRIGIIQVWLVPSKREITEIAKA